MKSAKLKLISEIADGDNVKFDFAKTLASHNIDLAPTTVQTLQVNVTKLCNQACVHCHVDSSPKRTEQISKANVDRALQVLASYDEITQLDLTGGAPELNPHFFYFVREARKLGVHVMVRHNLTVTLDGNPVTGESMLHIPEFYREQEVEVISSLPYYQEYFTDKQRGEGVFEKSVESLKMLNEQGFGQPGSGLELNLVYNPVGAFLPGDQAALERQYKNELMRKFSIVFNKLFVITNMPIHRFRMQLKKLGAYEDYMNRLVNAFNPLAAENVMCRSLVSVSHDGKLYDCDFNQMLDWEIGGMTLENFDLQALKERRIALGAHCFGCTAGSGSSCGGATA